MIAVAIYANKFVRFWYFVVKQRSFIVLNTAVSGREWQLVDLGLVFYRNRIGMSFPYKECGLVAFTFFQNENNHAFVKFNVFSLLQ